MTDFPSRYAALNARQKQAVDTLDGPVLVIAGPGTGKTELLSVRVANILKSTDALPANILCLTFTDSGAAAMRERLTGLIGADAYKVAVHTFHSFGAEIINRNGEYFYHGAHFRPADELSSYEVLRTIFETLPHDDVLASTMNGEYTYLRDTQAAISDLKKSGLTSDELISILDRGDQFVTWLQPRLNDVLGDRLSKKVLPRLKELLRDVGTYHEEPYELVTYEPLHALFEATLRRSIEDAEEADNTKPLSAWKREWCEKRSDGQLTLKDEKRSKRLRAVASIYYEYLVAMQGRALFDFDDMILRTVHALEVFDDLRLNLQEQYQYILVDEFQDTNDAQMRLLWNLTNNPTSEGRPNIMVVGDDDQAIYRFQGANLSNILDFGSLYRDVRVVTLADNYRSTELILSTAGQTVSRATERLERTLPAVDKILKAHRSDANTKVVFHTYPDEPSEYGSVAKLIAELRRIDPKRTIAVIARHHRQLEAFVPYAASAGVSVSYDRRDNALDSPPVLLLELMARVVIALADHRLDQANAYLPELLAHPAWEIPAEELWHLSVEANRGRDFWLDVMLTRNGKLAEIANWLLELAKLSHHEPLEHLIDLLADLVTASAPDDAFHSPLRHYFFPTEKLTDAPADYLAYLDALSSIRRKVRDYRPTGPLRLRDFVYLLDQYRALGLTVQASGRITQEGSSVELLSAHRSKGLEFDSVFILGLADNVWGETARSRSRLISYPHNLPIGIVGADSDEHIRLLFVALTRARTELYLSMAETSETGKQQLPVGYLAHLSATQQETSLPALVRQEQAWRANVLDIGQPTLRELLGDKLSNYKLSATHLCTYLDVMDAGPDVFLIRYLLRFPEARSPSAAFGSSIHDTLHRAHAHLSSTGKRRPVEDLLGDFESLLAEHHLPRKQHEHYAKKGSDVLSHFLAKRYDSFSPQQRAEQQFGSEGVALGNVKLTGVIDLLDIDTERKTITITDYKTGKSAVSWQGRTEYEKVKLHHYRQQLMFYKLLVESSRSYSGYTVESGIIEFVEPDHDGQVHRLELTYEPEVLRQFAELVAAVWNRIQSFHFEPTSHEKSLKGIEAFEAEVTVQTD